MGKKAIISGITGQDGSYLAELLLEKGYEVFGLQRRVSLPNTSRIDHLFGIKGFNMTYADLSDSSNLLRVIKKIEPDEFYNLGAQSHVGVSFDVPEFTVNTNALGPLRILETIRNLEMPIRYYQASSSEMFGKILENPQKETTPFNPQSPYGLSKVFAFHITKIYRTGYNVFASNGILFNHECVTAQTPVIIRANGLIDVVFIEEIVPHREDPNHGRKYSTVSNGNLEIWDKDKWSKIKTLTATWNQAGSINDKLVQRVVCRGGYYEATRDHLSFLEGGREMETGKLCAGDILELSILPDLPAKTVVSLEEAEFLGMMVADGYISQDGKCRFINNDKILRQRVSDLWQKVAGGYSHETRHKSGFPQAKEVFAVDLSGNRDYGRFIWRECYSQKLFKKVPRRILNAHQDILLAFLRGYNVCDGLKGGRQKTEFKGFTTNSAVLALGLWFLVDRALSLRITLHPELRDGHTYFHLNINSPRRTKGQHLQRKISEVKYVKGFDYTGWLFDLETESGTFSAGVGLTWVHNSPRRGVNFVTRKVTMGLSRIHLGLQKTLKLGNLDAKRDWGYAKDYVGAIWKILQHKEPDDFLISTGETHSVREFVEEVGEYLGMKIVWSGKGVREKGINRKTGKIVVEVDKQYFRPNEVEFLQGDSSKAQTLLGWKPRTTFSALAKLMTDADLAYVKQEAALGHPVVTQQKFQV